MAESVELVAGVDEVGRGPLAGPVVTAAVILDPQKPIEGLMDSKLLSEAQRECLAEEIMSCALAWSLGRAEVEEIDRINILQATMLAMQRCVATLSIIPTLVLVDGNRCPPLQVKSRAIIKGDQTVEVISAASIIAKVARDREMKQLDSRFPGYGLGRHKGYPTKAHIKALEDIGVSACHRRSFGPVKKLLSAAQAYTD